MCWVEPRCVPVPGLDLHEDLLILIPRMEVWGFVVSVVHVHDDSVPGPRGPTSRWPARADRCG